MQRSSSSYSFVTLFIAAFSLAYASNTLGAVEEQGRSTTDDATIETVIVTGTRLAATAGNMPTRVTVLERDTIEARNKASVLDLLRDIEGIQVTQYGGRGGLTSVFVQGAEPNFTVVLIDGVKVNDPNNSRGGSFNFANLNLGEVERIEIVRGPQSSIYGSDSLGGVINIITRTPVDDTTLSLKLEGGEDSHLRTDLSFSAPLSEHTAWAANLSATEQGEVVDGNDYSNRAAGVRLRRDERFSYDLSARWFDADSESFPEDSGGPRLAVLPALDERENQQSSYAAHFKYAVNQSLLLDVLATYLDQEEKLISPGIAPGVLSAVPPNRSDAELERTNLAVHAAFNLSSALSMTTGIDFQHEDGSQSGSVEFFPGFALPTDFDLDRDILGVFTELSFAPSESFLLSAALRHDDPDTADTETTVRLGGHWQQDNYRLFANWGEAFKLPSFFALGHGLVGNPNLKPETSEGWNVGVEVRVDERWLFTVSAFDNEFEDLIDFDFDLFTNVNRSKVDTSGVEASARLELENFDITAHLTYVDVDADGTKLRQRPQWRGGLNAQWSPVQQLDLALAWVYVDDTFDASIPTGLQTLDSYHRLDLSITWQVVDNLKLWMAADNATDESYEESVGFAAPGARARLGLKWTL